MYCRIVESTFGLFIFPEMQTTTTMVAQLSSCIWHKFVIVWSVDDSNMFSVWLTDDSINVFLTSFECVFPTLSQNLHILNRTALNCLMLKVILAVVIPVLTLVVKKERT